MKKIITIILLVCLMQTTATHATNLLYGVWEHGNVEITFLKDTLYIDDVNSEGEEYSYTVSNKTITAQSEMNQVSIKIVRVNAREMSFYYTDDSNRTVYTFKRKKVQVPTLGL